MTLKTPLQRALVPVLAGMVAIAALFATLWGIAVYTTNRASDPTQPGRFHLSLGDDVFDLGSTQDRADEIARGGPLLYPDLLVGGRRYLWVQHLGPDRLSGWHAFEAVPPGSPLTCATRWDAAGQRFVDPCTGAAYPADGTGLTSYAIGIPPDEHVTVDLSPGGLPGGGTTTVAP